VKPRRTGRIKRETPVPIVIQPLALSAYAVIFARALRVTTICSHDDGCMRKGVSLSKKPKIVSFEYYNDSEDVLDA
jgi:hypothetical protein